MKEKLQKIREEAIRQIEGSDELGKLNDVRVDVPWKKRRTDRSIKRYEGRKPGRPSGCRTAGK